MKRLLVIFVMLLLVTPAAHAEGEAGSSNLAYELAERTALMTEIGGVSQGELVRGTEVTVLEERGNWVKISVEGWVEKSLLMAINTESGELAPGTYNTPEGRVEVDEDGFTIVFMTPPAPPTPSPGNVSNSTSKDFTYSNVTYRAGRTITTAWGEVKNRTARDYTAASFTMTAYSNSGSILGVAQFIVHNLGAFETKTFEALFDTVLPSSIRYKIEFNTGY